MPQGAVVQQSILFAIWHSYVIIKFLEEVPIVKTKK